MKFNTIDSLFEYIENDIYKPDFSVIRFINVEDLKAWVKLKSYLTNFCEILRLSSFCSEDDLTPNINRMIMNIKSVKKNTIIIPLSEHFRINNNQINEAIERILKLEYSEEVIKSGIKIYIPMYRFESILEEFIKKDVRNNRKILPIELKSVIAYPEITVQMQRYIDWIEQYYLPNRPSDIEPMIISRGITDKTSQSYQNLLNTLQTFNNKNNILPLRYIEFFIDCEQQKITFSEVDY